MVRLNITNKVSMSRPGMFPDCFQTVFLPKVSVRADELTSRRNLIAITSCRLNYTYHVFQALPDDRISAESNVEIAKDYDYAICRGASKQTAQIRVKRVLFYRNHLKSRIVHTEERDILLGNA